MIRNTSIKSLHHGLPSAAAAGFGVVLVVAIAMTFASWRKSSATLPGADLAVAPATFSSPYRSRSAADLIRVIDGDTFEARVHLWPGLEMTTKVRLRGIDAPELDARCRDERIKAEAARAALAQLLAEGAVVVFEVSPDKYAGRVVASAATARTVNVSDALMARGVARAYRGGRREGWC